MPNRSRTGRLVSLVAAGALLTYGRPSVYRDTWNALLESDRTSHTTPSAYCHAGMNVAIAAQLIRHAAGRKPIGPNWAVPIEFAVVRFVSAKGVPGRWPYNTFLEPLVLLSFAPDSLPSETRDALARFVVYLTYSQAGLSKLLHGHDVWVRQGNALSLILDRYVAGGSRHMPRSARVERAVSRTVPVMELMALPLAMLAGRRFRTALPCASLLFHAAIFRKLRISFWELGALLFILGTGPTSDTTDSRVIAKLLRSGDACGSR